MPDIEGADILNLGDIGRDPFDTPGPLAQPGPGLAQSGFGDVEHGDSLERKIKQPIDEHRGPAAHVDDAATGSRGDRTNQFQRQARLALIPANARRALWPNRPLPNGPCGLFPPSHDTRATEPFTVEGQRSRNHGPKARRTDNRAWDDRPQGSA